MIEQHDTYELFPAGYLDKGCVAYLFGAVREVTGELTQYRDGITLADPFWYVPCRLLDGTEVMAPPIDRSQLVPIRTNGDGRKRLVLPMYSAAPTVGVQDNSLIGVDIDDLLARLRRYVGRGEMVPAELIRQLDGRLSRGYPLPGAWRHGQVEHLLQFVRTAKHDVAGLDSTMRRLEEDIREAMGQDGQDA
jgi:hypothetical protein